MPFHIAIDGPVASGKGTVARLVAQRLELLYIDTGAMYRVVALLAKRQNISLEDEDAIVAALQNVRINLRAPRADEQDSRLSTVLLNDEDVSWAIRTEEMSQGASKVAVLPKVRAHLVQLQQEIAAQQDVIMEGRDITYRVLPNAEMKIFLTASVESRAKRRHLDLQQRGHDVPYESVLKELQERDARDSGRTSDPLQLVEGTWELDTTHLSIGEVVDTIVAKAQTLRGSHG